MYRRTFPAVEHSRLQKACVGGLAHLAAERVKLADKVTLCSAADRWVARTVADGVHVDRKNSGVAAKPGGGKRRFNSGVTCADNGDVIISRKVGHIDTPFLLS